MHETGSIAGEGRGAMRFETLNEWLAWQETLHVSEIELGLDRCREVAQRLGIDRASYYVISVAGTNGKGSSVEMLQGVLLAAGYRVGSYTSPHLIRYNERIRLLGEEVEDALLCEAFARIDNARGDISLTYFEFSTLAALTIFQQAGIDMAILEVGLGGRLDAVNLLDADQALVTSIDLDHQDWLGDDRELIGAEKAGIFRRAQQAVCADPNPPASIGETASGLGTRLSQLNQDFSYQPGAGVWHWRSSGTELMDLPLPNLAGDIQLQNAAGVLKIIENLQNRFPVPREAIDRALAELCLNGRFQRLPGDIEVILDVAHNPHAAGFLASTLQATASSGRSLLVFSMLKDKDISAVVQCLGVVADAWYVADLQAPRAMDAESQAGIIRETLPDSKVATFDSVDAAFNMARRDARPGDRILVIGSFLTVAAVLKQQDSLSKLH